MSELKSNSAARNTFGEQSNLQQSNEQFEIWPDWNTKAEMRCDISRRRGLRSTAVTATAAGRLKQTESVAPSCIPSHFFSCLTDSPVRVVKMEVLLDSRRGKAQIVAKRTATESNAVINRGGPIFQQSRITITMLYDVQTNIKCAQTYVGNKVRS